MQQDHVVALFLVLKKLLFCVCLHDMWGEGMWAMARVWRSKENFSGSGVSPPTCRWAPGMEFWLPNMWQLLLLAEPSYLTLRLVLCGISTLFPWWLTYLPPHQHYIRVLFPPCNLGSIFFFLDNSHSDGAELESQCGFNLISFIVKGFRCFPHHIFIGYLYFFW